MPDDALHPARSAHPAGGAATEVTAWGIERGAEFGGPARADVSADGVALALLHGTRPPRLYPLAAIDGVRVETLGDSDRTQLTLFLRGGDVVELTGQLPLRATARAIENVACTLAEQTLALRAFGSPRAGAGAEHDRFFAPLLDARRGAERAGSALERVAAFDAPVMTRRLGDALAAFAAERFPESPPDRRALEAELRDLVEPVFARLASLDAAGRAVREGGDDVRFARWRDWAVAVRELFAAADAAWLAAVPALGAARGRRGRLWRRVLGLRG